MHMHNVFIDNRIMQILKHEFINIKSCKFFSMVCFVAIGTEFFLNVAFASMEYCTNPDENLKKRVKILL